jgi:hypothetical protein
MKKSIINLYLGSGYESPEISIKLNIEVSLIEEVITQIISFGPLYFKTKLARKYSDALLRNVFNLSQEGLSATDISNEIGLPAESIPSISFQGEELSRNIPVYYSQLLKVHDNGWDKSLCALVFAVFEDDVVKIVKRCRTEMKLLKREVKTLKKQFKSDNSLVSNAYSHECQNLSYIQPTKKIEPESKELRSKPRKYSEEDILNIYKSHYKEPKRYKPYQELKIPSGSFNYLMRRGESLHVKKTMVAKNIEDMRRLRGNGWGLDVIANVYFLYPASVLKIL